MTSPYLNVVKSNVNSSGYSNNQSSTIKKSSADTTIRHDINKLYKSKNVRASIQTAQEAIESHIMKPNQALRSPFGNKNAHPLNSNKSNKYLHANKKQLTS